MSRLKQCGASLEDPAEQAGNQAIEEASFCRGEAEPLDARDLVAHLRLARHRLDHLPEDDPDADAGADRAEATTDADRDPVAEAGGGDMDDGCKHFSSSFWISDG